MVEESLTVCPFCGVESIKILICKRRQWSPYQGEPDKMVKSKEEILSLECSSCKKTKKEIEIRIRNGVTHDEKVLERLKLSGLPLEIVEKVSE